MGVVDDGVPFVKLPRPEWYEKLSDEARAAFDATDWEGDNFLHDDGFDVVVVPMKPPPK